MQKPDQGRDNKLLTMESNALVHTFAAYVPNVVLEHVLQTPEPISKAHQNHYYCAVMFADISGFTRLAEQCALQGDVGVEQLKNILNDYFGRMISIVRNHGGDIVKFAGDALIALWQGSSQDLVEANRLACQCGWQLQSILSNYTAENGDPLRLRVVIASGNVRLAHIGGVFNRWEVLISGYPISQVGMLDTISLPGQVVISPEAYELIEPYVTAIAVGNRSAFNITHIKDPLDCQIVADGAYCLTNEMVPALRGYLPRTVVDRLEAGQDSWVSELRRVTVLFVNLPDLTYDTPLEQAQEVMQILQTCLYRYEGSINKLSIDDKGASLVALLGLPPLSHEDDPIRGISAALMMRDAVLKLNLRSSIGVSSGRVYCGTVGCPERQEYTVIGDCVNLSARLMQQANGAVLCDEASVHQASVFIEFSARRTMRLKGKSNSVPVYVARRLKQKKVISTSQEEVSIVGFEKERKLLKRLYDDLIERQMTNTVILSGEAGIGKSKLIADFINKSGQTTVLIGEGDAIEKATSYHAWQDIFNQRLGLEGVDSITERRRRVLHHLDCYPDLKSRAPLLNTILPIELPENELTLEMSGEIRAINTRSLLVQLLTLKAPDEPLIIILEDAQWLDSTSWSLALEVAQNMPGVLLFIVKRPPHGITLDALEKIKSFDNTHYLVLERLSDQEIAEFIKLELCVKTIDPVIEELVINRAEGHPLFTEQLIQVLRDRELISFDHNRVSLSSKASAENTIIELPNTIEALFTSRIDRLSVKQQLLIKVASVIGRTFNRKLLADIFPTSAEEIDVDKELDALVNLGLLINQDTDESAFKHGVTQQVAYDLMLHADRQALHKSISQWYEAQYPHELLRYSGLLAFHYRHAGVDDKALYYLEKAAEQALLSYANAEVVDVLKKARELISRSHIMCSQLQQSQWDCMLGRALLALGRPNEAHAAMERSLSRLDRPMPSSSKAIVLGLLKQAFWQFKNRAWPSKPIKEKISSDEYKKLLQIMQAFERLVQIYYFSGNVRGMLYATLASTNLAEELGEISGSLAECYASLSAMSGVLGLHRQAVYYSNKAKVTAAKINKSATWCWVLLTTGVYDSGIGQWLQAEAKFQRGMKLAARLGDHRRWEELTVNLASVMTISGNFAEAEHLYRQVYESALKRGDLQVQAWGLLSLGKSYYPLEKYDLITELLEKTEYLTPVIEQSGDSGSVLYQLALAALHALHVNDEAKAEKIIKKSIEVLRTVGRPTKYIFLITSSMIVEASLQFWGLRKAHPRARIYLEWVKLALSNLKLCAKIFPIAVPSYWYMQGYQAEIQGNTSLALKCWHQSLEFAEKLVMPYDEARACQRLALWSKDESDRSRLADRCARLHNQLGLKNSIREYS